MINVGFIGLGQRGEGLLRLSVKYPNVRVLGVCDEYLDRCKLGVNIVKDAKGEEPVYSQNYKDILAIKEIDAIIVATSWEAHVPISIDAMKAKKYVGVEVGGAYSLNDCHRLVETSEETGMPCMMLENCCYGKRETMILNMVRSGIFGEIVHCDGGYMHGLDYEILGGREIRHYRLRNYHLRNCDNYPTHQLGPICKILDINRGNRLLTLSSFSSQSAGLHERAVITLGANDSLSKLKFAQGDVTTTIIKCAGGQTITLSLDTSSPRSYSRNFNVRGTKGFYCENNDSIDLGKYSEWEPWNKHWGNATDFEEEYLHPIWKEYLKNDGTGGPGIEGGHGGMDGLVMSAFYEAVENKTDTPIDVYDTATWMCISTLSEDSIALGSQPVAIPDFTHGAWLRRRPILNSKYCLDREIDRDFD